MSIIFLFLLLRELVPMQVYYCNLTLSCKGHLNHLALHFEWNRNWPYFAENLAVYLICKGLSQLQWIGVKRVSGEKNLWEERAAGSKTDLQNPWDTQRQYCLAVFIFYLSWCKGEPILGIGWFVCLLVFLLNRIIDTFNEIEPGGQGVNGCLKAAFTIQAELSA